MYLLQHWLSGAITIRIGFNKVCFKKLQLASIDLKKHASLTRSCTAFLVRFTLKKDRMLLELIHPNLSRSVTCWNYLMQGNSLHCELLWWSGSCRVFKFSSYKFLPHRLFLSFKINMDSEQGTFTMLVNRLSFQPPSLRDLSAFSFHRFSCFRSGS